MALKGLERLSISKFVSRGPGAPSGTAFFESRIGASELMRTLSASAQIGTARVDGRKRSQIRGEDRDVMFNSHARCGRQVEGEMDLLFGTVSKHFVRPRACFLCFRPSVDTCGGTVRGASRVRNTELRLSAGYRLKKRPSDLETERCPESSDLAALLRSGRGASTQRSRVRARRGRVADRRVVRSREGIERRPGDHDALKP
jgi:hypothetical protein